MSARISLECELAGVMHVFPYNTYRAYHGFPSFSLILFRFVSTVVKDLEHVQAYEISSTTRCVLYEYQGHAAGV